MSAPRLITRLRTPHNVLGISAGDEEPAYWPNALEAAARIEELEAALLENEEYWKAAHDLIENARETVRLKIVYDRRPPGLFQDLQNAVYICRSRNVAALPQSSTVARPEK